MILNFLNEKNITNITHKVTVLPAKSDSEVMFCLQRDLESIDHLCISRIGLIHT